MRRFFAGMLAMCLVCLGAGVCRAEAPPCGLFSWHRSAVREGAGFWDALERAGVTEVYQMFAETLADEEVARYLNEAAARGIRVYALAGEPGWTLDRTQARLKAECSRVTHWNSLVAQEARICGVMLDVEPYLLEGWERHSAQLMGSYVDAMRQASELLADMGLRCILCIPFYYDTMGLEEELEELFQLNVSGIAVMNYLKVDEAGQLATETRLSRAYGMPLIQIYEMQAPKTHGLREVNTYHREGLAGVRQSWESLSIELPDTSYYAIHEYSALKEALDDE